MPEYIQLSQGTEHRPSNLLSTILSCIKKGYGGSAKDKITGWNTKVATGLDTVANFSEDNEIGVLYQVFGRQ